MGRTASIAIARTLLTGVGGAMILTGLVVLLASSVIHANPAHAAAALAMGAGIAALQVLRRVDQSALDTPWRGIVRLTDTASLAVLLVTTFVPLAILASHGEQWYDLAALGGILVVWARVLDALVADYRRIIPTLAAYTALWLPVVTLHPSQMQIAVVAAAMAAGMLCIPVLRRALLGVPRQYRLLSSWRRS